MNEFKSKHDITYNNPFGFMQFSGLRAIVDSLTRKCNDIPGVVEIANSMTKEECEAKL